MAETTNLTIRVEKEVKEKAEQLFSELGLNMSTAVNVFIRQAIRQGKIPFEISLSPNYETIQALEDVLNNRNLSATFESVEELMEDLNA